MIRTIGIAILAALLCAPLIILAGSCEVTTTSCGTCVRWGTP